MVCVDCLLGVTCACVLVGGSEFLFFSSDGQDCVRWYIFECLWDSCLLMIVSVLLFLWVKCPGVYAVNSWVIVGFVYSY